MDTAAIRRLGGRIISVVGVGVKTTGADDGPAQSLQVQLGSGEVRDNTPRLAEYGFTSMPPDGAHVTVLFVGGDRSNGVVIATGDPGSRKRNLQSGESAIYDNQGKCIHLKDGSIEIEAAGQPVTVSGATEVTVNGSTSITLKAPSITLKNAGAAIKSLCTQAFMDLFNAHTHPSNGAVPTQQATAGTHTTNIVKAE